MVQGTREGGKRLIVSAVPALKIITTVEGEVRPVKKRKKSSEGAARAKKVKTETSVDDDAYAAMVLGIPLAAPAKTEPCIWKCRHHRPLTDCTPFWQVEFLAYVNESVESSRI
jgi:hypothetical protein